MENTDILCSEKISLKEPEGCRIFSPDKEVIAKIFAHSRSVLSDCHQICSDIGNVEIVRESLGMAEMIVTGTPEKIALLKEYLRTHKLILERPQFTHRIAS